jgi:hypothetical protein
MISHLKSDQTGDYMSTYIEAEGLLYFTLRSDFDATLLTLVEGGWLKKQESGDYVFLDECGDEISESVVDTELMMIEIPDRSYRNLLSVIPDTIPLLDGKSEFSYFTTDGRFEIGKLSEGKLKVASDNEMLMSLVGDVDATEELNTRDNFEMDRQKYEDTYSSDWNEDIEHVLRSALSNF